MDDVSSSVLSLFPTTVLRFDVAKHALLRQELIACVLELQQRHMSVQKTNIGGWHSATDLHLLDNPAIQQLTQAFRLAMSQWADQFFVLPHSPDPEGWQLEMWANINRFGNRNRAHDHFRSDIVASGFYYLQCGGENIGGETVFINQQSRPLFIESETPLKCSRQSITPIDGQGYVFPSWQGHEVQPYRGELPRITMAFNAGHPDLPLTRYGDKVRREKWRKAWRKLFTD